MDDLRFLVLWDRERRRPQWGGGFEGVPSQFCLLGLLLFISVSVITLKMRKQHPLKARESIGVGHFSHACGELAGGDA